MTRIHVLLMVCCLVSIIVTCLAQSDAPARPDSPTAPATGTGPASRPLDKISAFFAPPKEFAGKFGDFRDVLKFDDGTQVKTAADWPKRRAEILKYWHDTMGPWKEVLDKPKLEFISKEHVEGIVRHKVKLEISPGYMQECYLLVPDGKGPFPAVLVVWYNDIDSAGIPKEGGKRRIMAFGYDLAKRGFVTLCVGGPGASPYKNADKAIQPLSFAAYCAANACNALANMPEVDPKRIGVTGHSYGGKWAMFASCLYEKFACAVWCDPGIVFNEADANANYWEPWYLGQEDGKKRARGVVTATNPRTGPYKTVVEAGRDLHELHALMAPRPFMVSGGDQDQLEHWVPLNHSIRLYKLLGHENRIAMTNRVGHSPTVESNEQMYAFFEHFLKETPATQPAK